MTIELSPYELAVTAKLDLPPVIFNVCTHDDMADDPSSGILVAMCMMAERDEQRELDLERERELSLELELEMWPEFPEEDIPRGDDVEMKRETIPAELVEDWAFYRDRQWQKRGVEIAKMLGGGDEG